MPSYWIKSLNDAKDSLDKAQMVLDNTVINCYLAGMSWSEIGEILGITRQGARQRYAHLVTTKRERI